MLHDQLDEQQTSCFNQKSDNFENITFLPITCKIVTKNSKTLNES